MFKVKKITRFIVLLSLPILLISCSPSEEELVQETEEKNQITIAVSRTPLSTPFFIARKNGYFAEQSIDVRFLDINGGHKCMNAVLAGDADMGTSSDIPIMFNSFKQDDFVNIATFVTSYNDVKILALRENGILKAADMEGKKVGVVSGSTSQFFLDFFLIYHNISPHNIMTVNLAPDEMEQALNSKRIDAVSIWEPFGFESMKNLGDKLIILPHEKVYRETFNLVVSRDFAEKNDAVLAKILRALQKAVVFIQENEKDAQQVIATELNKDEEFIQSIWSDFDFSLQLDQELILTLEDEAKWAIENKLVEGTSIPNYLRVIYTNPLDKVLPENVTIIH